MTFREIAVGSAVGLALAVAAVLTQVPDVLSTVGLVIVLASIAFGGADGTLPRGIGR